MSPFDVVDRVGPVAIFREGPRPRPPSDRHGALDVDGERVAVLVQTGPSWPMPDVIARGAALRALRDRDVARCFVSERAGNRWCHVVERVGGVALPALVRRVRKRAGALPPATAARLVRDLCRAQGGVDAAAPAARTGLHRYASSDAVAAVLADAVVAWDGRVVVAPRLFGAPADAPPWLRRASLVGACGALLVGLLAPALGDARGAVDAALLDALREGAPLTNTGVPALEALALRALAAEGTGRRGGRPAALDAAALDAAGLARALDAILGDLGVTGAEDEPFAAALVAELCGDRRRADLAWREELSAVAL